MCVRLFPRHALTLLYHGTQTPHPHSPESQTSPSFPHKLYFQSFWNAVPRFDAQQQTRPFYD